MLEPSVALQTALRAQLITDANVTALVTPANIRAGSTRPDKTPCVILANGQTQYLGRAAGDQHLAQVNLDMHVWAIEDGADTAKAIGFAVAQAVLDLSYNQTGFEIDRLDQPRVVWLRDVQPERSYTHGYIELEAVIRWRI